MTITSSHIAISLDGFVAGPHQSLDNPIGKGGVRLHEWVFATSSWRRQHGSEGGEPNADAEVVEELTATSAPTFTFVTDEIQAALTQAPAAAGARDVAIAGGAAAGAVQQ